MISDKFERLAALCLLGVRFVGAAAFVERDMSSLSSIITVLVCWSVIPMPLCAEVSFRKDVAPVLLEKCYACHNAETSEGGYSVATFESLLDPGDSGLATVTPVK